MSKSKGNVIEPAELQARYGTDAMRFTMAVMAAPGNDIPLAHERMEGYRAFANKLWNATRFVLLKLEDAPPPAGWSEADLSLVDRWILSGAHRLVVDVDRALSAYRFDRAAEALYHFVWHQFCDWYIECAKPDLSDPVRSATARAVLVEVLDKLLRLLHPFMPFVTEELWQRIPHRGEFLAVADWPRCDEARIDQKVERDMEILQDLVVKVRNLRAETNIDPSRRIDVLVHAESARNARLVDEQAPLLRALCRAAAVHSVEAFPAGLVAARGVVRGLEIALPLEGLLDFEAERTRLTRELTRLEEDVAARNRKLANDSFVQRAPAEVVEKERALQRELLDKKRRIESTLATLSGGPPA
jgi:valyl-tRNA synthetase